MRARSLFFRRYVVFAALFFLAGCASMRTNKSHYAGICPLLEKGEYSKAIAQVNAAKDAKKAYSYKNRVIYYLDMGMLLHWNGEYKQSNIYLEKAERAIEENFTKSVSRAAAALVGNDNLLAYSGEDYEDIYLNVFKALNYFALGKNDDAFVEIRRMNNKVLLLNDKYDKMAQELNRAEETHEKFCPGKSYFQESALARVLSLILYRNDFRPDDMRIDLHKIERGWKLQPKIYPFAMPNLKPLVSPIPKGEVRLDLLAFTGLAPEKKATSFYIHTEENVIILAGTQENYLGKQVLSGGNVIPWDGVPEGYHFKIQLPYMKRHPSAVSKVMVNVSGKGYKELYLLESFENVALETFEIKKPMIYLKTIIRAVTKGLVTEKGKAHMTQNMDGLTRFFVRIATDLAVDTTENADLRTSRFFPGKAYLREVHLKPGTYTIKIEYYGQNNQLLYSDKKENVVLKEGELHLLQSAYLN